MTVCIAVWPQFTGTYILVTDQMLSSDVASVDGAMKMATIAPVGQWTAMFAGDATRFPPLMDRVRECLGDVRNTRLSLDSVTAAVEKAYQRIVGELKGLGISYRQPPSGRSCARNSSVQDASAPIRVPEANGIVERFVRTARSECLDWLLILSARHLERALTVFIDHYNHWRPHRSLDLKPPNGRTSAATWTGMQAITLKRRDRLGGLLHEYERVA
jgi:Integrase core domain